MEATLPSMPAIVRALAGHTPKPRQSEGEVHVIHRKLGDVTLVFGPGVSVCCVCVLRLCVEFVCFSLCTVCHSVPLSP